MTALPLAYVSIKILLNKLNHFSSSLSQTIILRTDKRDFLWGGTKAMSMAYKFLRKFCVLFEPTVPVIPKILAPISCVGVFTLTNLLK